MLFRESVREVPKSLQAFVASAERREMAANAGRGRTITRGTRCAFCAKRHSLAFCAFSAISASSAISVLMRGHKPHDGVTMGRNARLQLDACLLHSSKA